MHNSRRNYGLFSLPTLSGEIKIYVSPVGEGWKDITAMLDTLSQKEQEDFFSTLMKIMYIANVPDVIFSLPETNMNTANDWVRKKLPSYINSNKKSPKISRLRQKSKSTRRK